MKAGGWRTADAAWARPATGLVLLFLMLAAPLRAQTGIAVGARAPFAIVQDTAGRAVNLSQWVGKGPVLIEFWATWCPNCRELEPKLASIAQRYGSRIKLVGVAVGVNQSLARAKLYAQRHNLPMEVLYDGTGAAADAYDAPATSYIVILDRNGLVVYTGLGADQDLEPAVQRAVRPAP